MSFSKKENMSLYGLSNSSAGSAPSSMGLATPQVSADSNGGVRVAEAITFLGVAITAEVAAVILATAGLIVIARINSDPQAEANALNALAETLQEKWNWTANQLQEF